MSDIDGTEMVGRISTGVLGLDAILKGGIPLYSTCVIAGVPGAGKTILTQEILFNAAKPDSKSLYLTTVSEPAAKVVRYQQAFSFFDPDKVGDDFFYLDLGEIIQDQGPTKSLDVLTKLIKDYAPRQIAIDSFRAIHDLVPNREEFRSFAFELAVKFSSWATTAFLIGEYTRDEINTFPEFAIADSIINLTVETTAGTTRRYLEVLKLRGSDFIPGKNYYKISRDGIRLFPRVFIRPGQGIQIGCTRVPVGIDQLDALLDGGIPEEAVVSITGSAGTGKTLMGIHFVCNGAQKYDEPGVYFSYEESDVQIVEMAKAFGWNIDELIERNLLRFCYKEPIDLSVEEELERMREVIQDMGAKRIVVDSLSPLFLSLGDENSIRQSAFQMSLSFKEAGVTAFVVSDVPVGSERVSRFGPEESVFDGIMIMKAKMIEGRRDRFVEIFKMRGTRLHAPISQNVSIRQPGL